MAQSKSKDVETFLKRCAELKSEIQTHLEVSGESKRSFSMRAGLQADFIAAFMSRDAWRTTKHAQKILDAIDESSCGDECSQSAA